MAKPARASITVWTGGALPFEERLGTKAHRDNELRLPVSSCPRIPSPVKVQVRSSWHIPLSTPWPHQGCDSPPQSSKPWPTPPASSWPDSCALPVRMWARTRRKQGDRPRCVTRSFLYLVSRCNKGRKYILSFRGTPEPPYTQHICFLSTSDQPNMFLTSLPGPGGTGAMKGDGR